MSESGSEFSSGEDYPPPAPTRRVDVAVALARMEAKLDVAIAQHQARLDEHSRRISEIATEQLDHARRIGAVENRQAGTDAVQKNRPAPQPWTTYAAFGISILLALYIVLNNYGPQQ